MRRGATSEHLRRRPTRPGVEGPAPSSSPSVSLQSRHSQVCLMGVLVENRRWKGVPSSPLLIMEPRSLPSSQETSSSPSFFS